MKKWFLHILLLAGLFSMLTTSCSQEEGLEPQASDEKVQVMFTIALDSPSSARSRGTWGDNLDNDNTNDYDDHIGDNFDNSIDPDKFFVKLTIGNTTYDVTNVVSWQETNGPINEYKFVGEVDVTATSLTGAKIMVFANMTPAQTTGDEIFTANYTNFPGTGVEYIPMWGVHTITAAEGLSLTPGTRTELTTPIYLLRAMAKVEVNLGAEAATKGYSISGVKMQKYNSVVNILPSEPEDGASYTTDYLLDECINASAATNIESNGLLPFTQIGENRYLIYVPEFEIDQTDTYTNNDDLNIQVLIKKGTVNTWENLDNKGYFAISNLVRNHWYQYTVTQINDGFGLTVKVKPWTLQDIDLDFSDIVTYNVTGWTEGTYGSIDEKNHLVYMTKEGETPKPAEFIFNIETPENCECEIGLTNNVDFSIAKEATIDGGIKVTITALDTTAEYPKTSLYAFAKDNYGRNIELDLTTDAQKPSTENQKSVNRFTIIQNW